MKKLPWARLAAEFSVIVVGVLVALLAESAWRERGERAEEREALLRIREELAVDSVDQRNDEAWIAMSLPAADAAAGVLAGSGALGPEAALAVLYGAVLVNNTRMEQGTWQDLTSAGRSGLISDPILRRRLINYFSQRTRRERIRETHLPTELRTRVVATLPVAYTQAVLDGCVRRAPVPSELVEGARSDAFEALLACNVAPEGGAGPLLARIRGGSDVDLQLGALRYGLRTFREEIVRTGVTLDSLALALDRALGQTR